MFVKINDSYEIELDTILQQYIADLLIKNFKEHDIKMLYAAMPNPIVDNECFVFKSQEVKDLILRWLAFIDNDLLRETFLAAGIELCEAKKMKIFAKLRRFESDLEKNLNSKYVVMISTKKTVDWYSFKYKDDITQEEILKFLEAKK